MEQYHIAAVRHRRVAERLEEVGETDDAAYHYGLVGENALKHALELAGVWAAWQAAGFRRNETPMGKHFPRLTDAVGAHLGDVQQHASGRIGAALNSVVSDLAFATRYQGWMIDIRYADSACTPVDTADCQRWAKDADEMLCALIYL